MVLRFLTVVVEEAVLGEGEPSLLPQHKAIAALFKEPTADDDGSLGIAMPDHRRPQTQLLVMTRRRRARSRAALRAVLVVVAVASATMLLLLTSRR